MVLWRCQNNIDSLWKLRVARTRDHAYHNEYFPCLLRQFSSWLALFLPGQPRSHLDQAMMYASWCYIRTLLSCGIEQCFVICMCFDGNLLNHLLPMTWSGQVSLPRWRWAHAMSYKVESQLSQIQIYEPWLLLHSPSWIHNFQILLNGGWGSKNEIRVRLLCLSSGFAHSLKNGRGLSWNYINIAERKAISCWRCSSITSSQRRGFGDRDGGGMEVFSKWLSPLEFTLPRSFGDGFSKTRVVIQLRFITLQVLATNSTLPTLRKRYLDLAWSCIRCEDIEGTFVSALIAFMGETLHAPEIIRRQLFRITDLLFLSGRTVPRTQMSWLIPAVYVCRTLAQVASHREVVILASARISFIIFFCTSITCACHLSRDSIKSVHVFPG